MAAIREYENMIDTLRPSDAGVEGFAQAGRRIGTFYHQEGEEIGGAIQSTGQLLEALHSHGEITHGGVAFAGTYLDQTQKWNELSKNADPNDPTVLPRFMQETFEPAMEKFQSGFLSDAGQRWAAQRVEEARQHFEERGIADMSGRAGMAIKTNFDQLGNAYSAAAFSDPSSVKDIFRHIDATVDGVAGTSPNLTPEQDTWVRTEFKQKLKEQIAESAVAGFIYKNPNADYTKFANDPEIAPYLKATEPAMLQRVQQNQQRMAAAYDRQAQADARRAQTEAIDDKANKSLADHTHFDNNGKLTFDAGYFQTWKEIASTPGASPSLVRSALELGEHLQKQQEEVPDNQFVRQELQKGILDGETDLESIMKARKEDQIGDQTFAHLYQMYNELRKDPTAAPGFKDALDAAKAAIVSPTIPGARQKDVGGERLYSDFVQKFVPMLTRMNPEERAKAMNFKDPHSLINTVMAPYVRSTADRVRDMMMINSLGQITQDGGVTVPTAAPAERYVGGLPVPLPLMGNTNLESNGSVFRDKTTGKMYDQHGYEIKQ
ncbi:MAG TPA: hypothetical protein VKS78_04300 [Roseiarcus sp.]|nr:hypothetical protein [Roseiarcus sp.]